MAVSKSRALERQGSQLRSQLLTPSAKLWALSPELATPILRCVWGGAGGAAIIKNNSTESKREKKKTCVKTAYRVENGAIRQESWMSGKMFL